MPYMPNCACRIQTAVQVQVLESVVAVLFLIYQSKRMSSVFQIYTQAYILCLNISRQYLYMDRLPDVFLWILLRYIGSEMVIGQFSIHMLHCLFTYSSILFSKKD